MAEPFLAIGSFFLATRSLVKETSPLTYCSSRRRGRFLPRLDDRCRANTCMVEWLLETQRSFESVEKLMLELLVLDLFDYTPYPSTTNQDILAGLEPLRNSLSIVPRVASNTLTSVPFSDAVATIVP